MPYVSPTARASLRDYDTIPLPQTPGELNYALTRIIDRTLGEAPGYEDYNAVIGVLACMEQEIYRRLVVPYEQRKIVQNGDVFRDRSG